MTDEQRFYLEVLFVWIGMVFMLISGIVWLLFVRDFIRKYGGAPSFVLFNWSAFLDYRKARKICTRVGRVPWFIRVFEVTFGGGLCIVIGLMLYVVLRFG